MRGRRGSERKGKCTKQKGDESYLAKKERNNMDGKGERINGEGSEGKRGSEKKGKMHKIKE